MLISCAKVLQKNDFELSTSHYFSDANTVFVLYLIHYEGTLQRTKVLYRSQHVEHKFLIILHIGRMYLQQIVKTARNVITLCHLWNVPYNFCEVLSYLTAQPVHLYIAEDNKPLVKFFRIEHGYVFLDISLTLQPLQTFKHWGRGEAYSRCQFFSGETGILLQRAQNLQVNFI